MLITKASIITIGDELLIGQTIDTNSAFIAQELNKIGIHVHYRIAVGDVWDDIWNTLDEESKKSDLIILTGGLGPTADDITKPLLCKYFNGEMIINKEAEENVKNIFSKFLKRPLTERNLKQADVPSTCTVLINKQGTAPGMWFEKKIDLKSQPVFYVSLPGVPFEMKWLVNEVLIPKIKTEFETASIQHKTLLTAGIGESYLADKIKNFEDSLPQFIKLAYLPSNGMVKLRLSCYDKIANENKEIEKYFSLLKKEVSDHLIVDEDISIQEVIARLLKQKNKTLVTAESCSGGYISHLLTKMPGSSDFFLGSVVCYDNSVKETVLGVNQDTLDNYGAVSEETVWQMAQGVRTKLHADYAIAVSGIMGPSGGTEDKPVGTVWIAIANNKKVKTHKMHFRYSRIINIEITSTYALYFLHQFIVENT